MYLVTSKSGVAFYYVLKDRVGYRKRKDIKRVFVLLTDAHIASTDSP